MEIKLLIMTAGCMSTVLTGLIMAYAINKCQGYDGWAALIYVLIMPLVFSMGITAWSIISLIEPFLKS